MPDPLSFDRENRVTGSRILWQRVEHPRPGLLPRQIEERVAAYGLVSNLVEDTGAEVVLFAVENDVDRLRVGVIAMPTFGLISRSRRVLTNILERALESGWCASTL